MTTIEKNRIMRGRLVNAPSVEEAKANLEKEHTASNWYDYGKALSKAHRNQEAIDVYSQGLVEFPFSALLYFGRGCRYMGDSFEQAIADFTMAIQIERDVNFYWYYRAVTYNTNGFYREAIADFKEAMQLRPARRPLQHGGLDFHQLRGLGRYGGRAPRAWTSWPTIWTCRIWTGTTSAASVSTKASSSPRR